jgi:hypothetical protein
MKFFVRMVVLSTVGWASAVSAKLPVAVEVGLKQIILAIVAFFGVFLTCYVIGTIAGRRLAPDSRATREIIVTGFGFAGAIAGVLLARSIIG